MFQYTQRIAGIEEISTSLDPSGNSIPGTQSPLCPPTSANMSSAQPESAHIEPVDDETPNETTGTTPHEIEATAFAKAINCQCQLQFKFQAQTLGN